MTSPATTSRACASSACTCGCCRASGDILETLSIRRCDCSGLSGGVLGGGREVREGDDGGLPLAVGAGRIPGVFGEGGRELVVERAPGLAAAF